MTTQSTHVFMRKWPGLLSLIATLGIGMTALAAEDILASTPASRLVTEVAQFKTLSGSDFLAGCNFRLTGVVTLVDTNRDLVVLNDATGAVALHFPVANQPLKVARRVTITGIHCEPLLPGFPAYPHHPSGQEISSSFETPMNWGTYNLTRMRGYLRPAITGEYRFWIASDNSSELWLSPDASPANAKKVATVLRFTWTDSRQWTKHPAQRSELIQLRAGQTYYIEALQEQTVSGEHLAVAWQQPGAGNGEPEIISGRYLAPWMDVHRPADTPTNGILREYWTNYFDGYVDGIPGPRPYKSALTLAHVEVTDLGPGTLPKPAAIDWSQPLPPEKNYPWVSASGRMIFKAAEGEIAYLEIFNGKSLIPVRALHWNDELTRQLQQLTNPVAHVQGVCEGVEKPEGMTNPELIWCSNPDDLVFTEGGPSDARSGTEIPGVPAATNSSPATLGYFGTRGIVTFNNRVFDKDLIFIQEANSALLIALEASEMKRQLQVGHYVDVGGALSPSTPVQSILPLFVADLGMHSMPSPIINPEIPAKPGALDGKWIELEGVVRRINPTGTLAIAGGFGAASLWIGETEANMLTNLVDAKLRVRGVLYCQDMPLLLVPSPRFVDVVEEPPPNPFARPTLSIANLLASDAKSHLHRVHVEGLVTYLGPQSLQLQDASGAGIRVAFSRPLDVKVGDQIAVAAFTSLDGYEDILDESIVQHADSHQDVVPKDLNLAEALSLSSNQRGMLVQVAATLLTQRTNSAGCVLELQAQQRVFTAVLAPWLGEVSAILPGSKVQVTGICDDNATDELQTGDRALRAQFLSSLKIHLRSPSDVIVLSKPPWWTWQRGAALLGTLLAVLAVSLLWVHLLQRRLERQKAARLAFSKLVLERLEAERQRIAVNLHDSLGQTLLVVKNHAALAMQNPSGKTELTARLNEISGATTQAIEEVRRITSGLRPYQLDRLGLTQAIRATIKHASDNNTIVFASRVEEIDGLFNKDAEIHVYRIVQEAITNVIKHSGATEAAVVIKRRDKSISLSIRDNGRGFDMAKSSDQLHDLGYGLTGIAERVRIMGGTLAIDTHPGNGTSLTVEVPIQHLSS